MTWFEGVLVDDHGMGHYEVYDSAYRQVAQVHAVGEYQGDLHEFVLTEAGSALFTCYGQARADLSKVGGASAGSYYYGVMQEVDVATGHLLFEWRSEAHVGLDESYLPVTPGPPWDYFHINSIDVDPTDGNLVVSARNTWAGYKLDRRSGAVLWRLGGKRNDFALGPGAHFAFQHDVRRHPDGTVTIFDDEAGPADEATQSRGVVPALAARRHLRPALGAPGQRRRGTKGRGPSSGPGLTSSSQHTSSFRLAEEEDAAFVASLTA